MARGDKDPKRRRNDRMCLSVERRTSGLAPGMFHGYAGWHSDKKHVLHVLLVHVVYHK